MYSILFIVVCSSLHYVKSNISQDVGLNFTELMEKYGQTCEEFDVVTEDDYILKVFHIPGNKTNPVLLVHGLFFSAEAYALRGSTSLAMTLANKGYDVWAANMRGTLYSRRHVTLNPDTDLKFWDFSFHDQGVKDLPACIDFVLNKTNQDQLSYIGHSQGTQVSFVLGSVRPEYNAKMKVCIALAPVAFLSNMSFPTYFFKNVWPALSVALTIEGQEEIFNNGSLLLRAIRATCSLDDIGYEACARGIVFRAAGSDPEELEPEFFPVALRYYPCTTSRKNIDHVAQIVMSKKFAQYDYGLGNYEKYGSSQPPDYSLNKITSPVILIAARNDKISTIPDILNLRDQLPNPIYYEVPRDEMNHIDFVQGRTMQDYLYPYLFDVLQNYTQTQV